MLDERLKDLGVTQAMISRWENGESDPPDRVKRRMSEMVQDAFVVAPAPTWVDLVQKNPAIEFVTDAMGVFKAVSQGAVDLLGVPREKIEGRPAAQFLSGEFGEVIETVREKGMFQNNLAYAQSLGRLEFDTPGGSQSRLVDFIHWPRISQARSTYCVHSGAVLDEAQYTVRLEERGRKLLLRKTL